MISIKRRGYRHLDSHPSSQTVDRLTSNPLRVAAHPFLPLLHRTSSVRKFDKEKRIFKSKEREIYFCSHVDSALLEVYGHVLSNAYETYVAHAEYSDCVLAYRKLNRSVASFANDVFEGILSMGDCDVVALDVEHFFDTLDHKLLKSSICRVLKVDRLTEDWFSVFKHLTSYAYVEEAEIKIACPAAPRRRTDPYCSIQELKQIHKIQIKKNRQVFGIPQGTPISALLSNIYMLPFDERMSLAVSNIGGIYRRYSDDIIIVIPHGKSEQYKNFIVDALATLRLTINDAKTINSTFSTTTSGLKCSKPIPYLGFVFDGQTVRLRGSTIARHLNKMHRAVHIAVKKFCIEGHRLGRIPKRRLYERFSHLGPRRQNVAGKRVFGNFYAYAASAHRQFGSLSAIRHQVSVFWPHLHDKLATELSRYTAKTTNAIAYRGYLRH